MKIDQMTRLKADLKFMVLGEVVNRGESSIVHCGDESRLCDTALRLRSTPFRGLCNCYHLMASDNLDNGLYVTRGTSTKTHLSRLYGCESFDCLHG